LYFEDGIIKLPDPVKIQWFSLGTLTSSTTKTGCHDIAEILLKVALNTNILIQIQFLFGKLWKPFSHLAVIRIEVEDFF
jgi:hypothetical protein